MASFTDRLAAATLTCAECPTAAVVAGWRPGIARLESKRATQRLVHPVRGMRRATRKSWGRQ
jgi:hypothetical protein